ncbi:MAG TPA: nuclear transport factor 2 family protein [Terriglobales bacterium]|nr:nuclear transport factor 2 family protein [Terriglobales bacterium]
MPKASALLLVVFLLDGCTMWKEKQSPTWSSATGAEQFERLLWQEIKARNWPEVEKRLGANLVVVTPNGKRDRAAHMEYLKGLEITDYSIGEMEVTPNGDDMVLTYTMTMQGTLKGQPMGAATRQMLSVWQQVGTNWIAVVQVWMPVTPEGQQRK